MQPATLLLFLAGVGVTTAQSLTDVLLAQNASLSVFNTVWLKHPEAAKKLNNLSNVTFLAPNNDAMEKYLQTLGYSSFDSLYTDKPGGVLSHVAYHLLRGVYYTSSFAATPGKPVFIATDLTVADDPAYDGVTGGQRVEGIFQGNNVSFISGLGENSTVVTPVR
jgi:hypothetical protein